MSRLSPPLETGAIIPSHTLAAASNKDSGHGLLAQMDSFRYNEHKKNKSISRGYEQVIRLQEKENKTIQERRFAQQTQIFFITAIKFDILLF